MTESFAQEKVCLNRSKYAEEERVDEIQSKKQEKNDIEVVAIDCEMVGIRRNRRGNNNMLARVSIVNSKGETIYDKFVKPTEIVTDYRTPVSGIRPEDIEYGEAFAKVQKEVLQILKNKLLIGHSPEHDFRALKISHPKHMIRDTSLYSKFLQLTKGQKPSLKQLTSHFLGASIQEGEHSSVQDAKAALQLYMLVRNDWESQLQKRNSGPRNEDKPNGSQSNFNNSAIVQKQENKDVEVVAIFCEKVGILQGNMLARVSIVNFKGKIIYDKFVKPTVKVTDYRTSLNGIQPEHIEHGEVFSKVKMDVQKILENKLLVGHSLEQDLGLLEISHPKYMIRDTSVYPKFIQFSKGRTPSLKRLAFYYLEIILQHGQYRSVQSAKIALRLYKLFRNDWESQLQKIKSPPGNGNKPYNRSQRNKKIK